MNTRYLLLMNVLLALGLAMIAGCSSTEPGVVGGVCTKDADCNDGYFCTDKGVCLPKSGGDTDTEADADVDVDIREQVEDWEQWEDECGDMVGMPAPQYCLKYSCEPVPPPACYDCAWLVDPAQDGAVCYDDLDRVGVCDNGVCQTFVDGDVDDNPDYDYDFDFDDNADADWPPIDRDEEYKDDIPVQSCSDLGGFCQDYAECPLGSRATNDSGECGWGVCCLPLGKVDCYLHGGQCAVSYGVPDFCPNGTRMASSAQECDVFGEWCCEPLQVNCVGEGGFGSPLDQDPTNDVCCEGLTQLPPDVPNGDQCITPPGMGFYCSYCGNGTCDSRENWCNCEDCAAPGECRMDSQCAAPSCYEPWDDVPADEQSLPYTMCTQVTPYCDPSSGTCQQYEEYYDGQTCNYVTGLCEPSTVRCRPLGAIGTWGLDACCDGLAPADPAQVGSNGECLFPDCNCFVCINATDNYCDYMNGENECNSDDCNTQPGCGSDADCRSCANTDYGCEQNSGSCWDGMCYNGSVEVIPGAICDAQSGYCLQSPDYSCQYEGGMCVNTYGCPTGYNIGNLQCPDSSPLCCMPQQQTRCERQFDGYCSDALRWCETPFIPSPDGNAYGCPGTDAARAVCCVPGGLVGCTSDSDCGETTCSQQGSICIEEYPQCSNGECIYGGSSFDGAMCDYTTGQCWYGVR